MELIQASTEQAHDGISSKHPANNICGLGRAAGKGRQTQEQNPSDFCLFAVLVTDYLYSDY